MPLFRPTPLPQQRRPSPLPAVADATSSAVGTAAGTSTAQAFAPFGTGESAGGATATGVGAAIAQAVGTAAGTSTVTGVAVSDSIFPLGVSADGRYLEQADGVPFLICGDSTWEIAVNLSAADQVAFLDDCVARGITSVMFNAIEHHYTAGNKPPKDVDGNLPFTQRMDGAAYTGSPNGTTAVSGTQGQFAADAYSNINNQAPDCTFFNATYWNRIDAFLDACLSRGIAVFVWPMYLGFHGNQEGWISELVVWDAVIGAGGFTGQPFANGSKSKMFNYGAALAARWSTDYPNIIWVAGGDYGSGGQTMNAAQTAAVKSCIDGIKSVAPNALWTAHWDRPCISDDTAISGVTWDLNFAYSGDDAAEVPRRAYAVAATKPAYWGEGFYEAGLFGGSAPFRKYLYWGFLGGIAGGFFGHEQLWRFDDGSPGTLWSTLLATQGRLDAARQFAFFASRPWHRLKPSGLGGMGTLITVGGGTASPQSTTYVAAACTSEGDLLLAYMPPAHSGTMTVDMTKLSAMAVARWFDPTNATFTAEGAFLNTGTRSFTRPGSNSAGDGDWLLVLETVEGESAGVATATGVGAALAAASGAAVGSSTAAATGSATAEAVGTSAGSATATGIGVASVTATGTAAGSATADATGAAIAAAVGTSAGSSTADATGAAIAQAVGTAAGTSTVAGFADSIGQSEGASAGTSTATGIGAAIAQAVGAAAGVATVSGVGAVLAASMGTAAGTSEASASGAAIALAVGTAVGASTAEGFDGSLSDSGVGTSAGTSTATGCGAAIAVAVGTAQGTSTASAFSQPQADPMILIEDALYAWVVAGSGLDEDHVIWGAAATGGGPVPSGTYIAMELLGINRVSDDWMRLVDVGGQIEHHVRGTRHPTLKLTCFAGDRYGPGRAQLILERVLTSIRLPSVAAALRDADVGIGVRGPIRVVNVPRSTMFDPRATVEIGLHIVIDISEPGSSIERVNAEVPGRPAFWVPEPPE